MNTPFLNVKNFLAHREQVKLNNTNSKGYMHTDIYQFFINDERIGTIQSLADYTLSLYFGTRECYQFEREFWNQAGHIDMHVQLNFDKQIGAMYSYYQSPPAPFKPFVYWKNEEGRQYVGTYLFGQHPAILEFNGPWVRMFYNEDFEQKTLSAYVEAFTDKTDLGMQQSINTAKGHLNLLAALDFRTQDEYPPVY